MSNLNDIIAEGLKRRDAKPAPTLEIIGELHNVKVLLNRSERAVILGTEPPIKFSIDNPYIQGTKLERDARRALDGDGELTIPTKEG